MKRDTFAALGFDLGFDLDFFDGAAWASAQRPARRASTVQPFGATARAYPTRGVRECSRSDALLRIQQL
jgi:hypothetical protein